MTLEALITLLTIENNNITNYIVTFEYRVTGTAFAILAMFFFVSVRFLFCDFLFGFLFQIFFPGRFDTSGSMIRLSVPEIEGGTLSVTEKEKDWSWSILVVGLADINM